MAYRVPPGNETGTYYLLFCGFSDEASYKDVKDYGRTYDVKVDWVDIYENNLGGWIRVLGHENLVKAYDVFNGAIIKGHALQMDARNETQPVVLRTCPAPRKHGQPFLPTLPTPGSSFSYIHQPTEVFLPHAVAYEPYHEQPISPTHYFPPRQVDFGSQSSFQMQLPHRFVTHYQQNTVADQMVHSGSEVQTVMRKIVIKKLPVNTEEDAVRALVDKALTLSEGGGYAYDPTCVEKVEMARHKNGTLRGHAFVWMRSYQLASEVISRLDGTGDSAINKLEVTLAKEGAEPYQPKPHNSATSNRKPDGKSQLKADKKSPYSPSSKSSKTEKPKRNAVEKISRSVTPAVADGSGLRSSRNKSRSDSTEDNPRSITPAVADGSGSSSIRISSY